MDFIALDVETANADMSSICALGLVHFKNGQVFKDVSTLIDPEDHFDPINISIHGIRPEDVSGKPKMSMVYPALLANLKNCVVVHHGNFDPNAMRRVAQRHNFAELECAWLDSCQVARSAWPRYAEQAYALNVIAKDLCITFKHHQAAEDARCAGLVVLRAIADTGVAIENWFTTIDERRRAARYYPDPSRWRRTWSAARETVVFTGTPSIDRSEAAQLAITGSSATETSRRKTGGIEEAPAGSSERNPSWGMLPRAQAR